MDETTQTQYDRLLSHVLRMGGWLSGPQARLLPPSYWGMQFRIYQEHLSELRRLGDELRPVVARPWQGDATMAEVEDLFG